MLKNILNLEGAKELTTNEKKVIKGGLACTEDDRCPKGSICDYDSRRCIRA
ncbi:hypothetical protein SAMN06265346_10163 [Flavobacterium hercynium]|jgi:hypothetical protein|nr:hypothetical protein SAMN06265346_10163 [Flavobacterium hercynium]